MAEPRKHHYIPVCYLKQWAHTDDSRLCEHKFVTGQGVKPRRTHPEGTGYQVDLYRTDGVPGEVAHHLENRFMRLVDDDAARALGKIVSGDKTEWTQRLRSGWTRFILSLLFRNPETVAHVKRQIVAIWTEGVKALRANWSERRTANDPETFEEFFAKTNPHAVHIAATNFLTEIIDNKNIGPVIFDMKWTRIDLGRSSLQLLTSDRPLDMPLGLGDPESYIALPVSPRLLFLAAHDAKIGDTLGRANPTQVVKNINKVVVQQARRFVWGSSDSQLTFIKRNFGTVPDRPLITDQQRENAINAARGKAAVQS